MGGTTVRITERAHGLLEEIARAEDLPLTAVLEKAIEEYRRRRFLEAIGEGYAALREDTAAWGSVLAERAEWDVTLADGLPPGPNRTPPRTRKRKAR